MNALNSFGRQIFRFFCSLKLAVLLIVSIAVAIAIATILESLYDTKTGQFWVYRTTWFQGLLGLLGVLIFCVALSRWPWKRRHVPFLLAHVGILTLLGGSALTQVRGLDGSLMVQEGEASSRVELDEALLVVEDGLRILAVTPIPWMPPGHAFKSIPIPEAGIVVDQYIPSADPDIRFVPRPAPGKFEEHLPALHIRVRGGPMPYGQDLWLWAGDPAWAATEMGPATFMFIPPAHLGKGSKPAKPQGVALQFWYDSKGRLHYRATNRQGAIKEGNWPIEEAFGKTFDPGWMPQAMAARMGLQEIPKFQVEIQAAFPHAANQSTFIPARIQFGSQAPPGAIRISEIGKPDQYAWISHGDQGVLNTNRGKIRARFQNRAVNLNFGIQLHRFQVDYYEGTQDPASYSSKVGVKHPRGDIPEFHIQMNEPLEVDGITLYQSSFIPGDPRPTVSIFSVNQDPGRWLKYIGSILIVCGSILLFAVKYFRWKWMTQ